MYKMNRLLKIIVAILILTTIVIVNNRIILWLLLFVLSFYHLHKHKKLLVIDLVLVFLLGLSVNNDISLLIFKIIFIVDFIITYYFTMSKNDKKITFRKKTTLKKMYYNDNFDRIVSRINEKKIELYDEDVSIDSKIEQALARDYLQARIRYYGYSSKKKNRSNWNRIDTLILLFSIILFILFFILR